MPEWAEGARLRTVSAERVGDAEAVSAGWAEVTRAFRAGDIVELELPMAPRLVVPDPRIDAVRGCVAVERGPEVFALESVDLSEGGDVGDVALTIATAPTEENGRVWVDVARRVAQPDGWPYTTTAPNGPGDTERVALVPYHDWGNRGPSTMRVWIPTS